jgi:hypothetical protein
MLTELYWRGGGGVGRDTLTTRLDAIWSVGGFYAPDDNSQHAVFEAYTWWLPQTTNGSLYDAFWQTGAPQIRFLAT